MHIYTYIYACVYRMSHLSGDTCLSYAWLTQAGVQVAERDTIYVLAGASPTNGSPELPLPLPYIYILKGKCALGPSLSILVIDCQHKCFCVNICKVVDKVQIMSKGMFLDLVHCFMDLCIVSKCWKQEKSSWK
jgi:hypothetical protein